MRQEIQLQNYPREIGQRRENWRYVSQSSVYAAEIHTDGKLLVCGSTWDRRHTPFTEETRNSLGEVTILRPGTLPIKEKQMLFPSMVNAIVPLPNGVFIGCKRGEQSFNLLDKDFEISRTIDDQTGDGIYNALFDERTQSIIAVTRNGLLVSLDPETLEKKNELQVNSGDARLWSLGVKQNGILITGDYSGKFYLIDQDTNHVAAFDMRNFLDASLPEEQKIWEPSIFGVATNNDDQVITTIRWGQLTWFDDTRDGLRVAKSLVLPEEISQVTCIPTTNNLLIGTRSGKVILYQDIPGSEEILTQLVHIPPAFQTDNSVWSISCVDGNALVCFADGQVVSLDIN